MGRAPFYDQFRELIVRSDRYHRAASAVLTVLLCVALAELAARAPSRPVKRAVLGAWVLG